MTSQEATQKDYDLVCVGGGIMSATLALMVKLLDPNTKILIFERLDKVSMESSAAWNNSGTGHSAFCELNYTPEKNGKIDVSKAINIFSQFEQSKFLWSYLVTEGYIKNPKKYIRSVPHYSWVQGKNDVDFLKKRHQTMTGHFMFEQLQFSEDPETLKNWFPLIMNGRTNEQMAATRMNLGTEINFGALTRKYFKILKERFNTPVFTKHEVLDVDPGSDTDWLVEVKNRNTGEISQFDSNHVFIGAGGGALPLLQKVEIKAKEGYGGFPVSGQWLICKNKEIINQHHAKVYGKAGLNAPPMSTPHLDTRYINGKKELLFGPFAGFSTKFLKKGSYTDLFKSINFHNLPSIWGVFWHNLPLTEYLIGQVSMNHEDRMAELQKFVKNAQPEDWELKVAGQRVQIIKRDEEEGGVLEFGTDVVHGKTGAVTALLGASPGASVAVSIMLEVIQLAFPEKIKTTVWQERLQQMLPFWNRDLSLHETEFLQLQKKTSHYLKLEV